MTPARETRVLARLAAAEYDLTQQAAFTRAVEELDSALTRRAHEDVLASIDALEVFLTRVGPLSADEKDALMLLGEQHIQRLVGFSDEVAQQLAVLITTYAPPRGFTYWWETKAVPYLKDDSF